MNDFYILLVFSSWSGLVLDPGESKAVTFSVRPESVPHPPRNEGEDYYRWSIGIRSGRYTVRYSMFTDADYFDGDSHYRLPEVQKEARKLSAVEKRVREVRQGAKRSGPGSLSEEIAKLAALKQQGILSDDEFQAAKRRLLNG